MTEYAKMCGVNRSTAFRWAKEKKIKTKFVNFPRLMVVVDNDKVAEKASV